jgi:hypothetical protein
MLNILRDIMITQHADGASGSASNSVSVVKYRHFHENTYLEGLLGSCILNILNMLLDNMIVRDYAKRSL